MIKAVNMLDFIRSFGLLELHSGHVLVPSKSRTQL
jgi:hypothetical protein